MGTKGFGLSFAIIGVVICMAAFINEGAGLLICAVIVVGLILVLNCDMQNNSVEQIRKSKINNSKVYRFNNAYELYNKVAMDKVQQDIDANLRQGRKIYVDMLPSPIIKEYFDLISFSDGKQYWGHKILRYEDPNNITFMSARVVGFQKVFEYKNHEIIPVEDIHNVIYDKSESIVGYAPGSIYDKDKWLKKYPDLETTPNWNPDDSYTVEYVMEMFGLHKIEKKKNIPKKEPKYKWNGMMMVKVEDEEDKR